MTTLIENHRSKLEALCRKYDVSRLDLFGSALNHTFDADRSDLDFVVEFNHFTVESAADRFFGLLIDLEDLFGRNVDLVSYKGIRNPYFKKSVDDTRVMLYAA